MKSWILVSILFSVWASCNIISAECLQFWHIKVLIIIITQTDIAQHKMFPSFFPSKALDGIWYTNDCSGSYFSCATSLRCTGLRLLVNTVTNMWSIQSRHTQSVVTIAILLQNAHSISHILRVLDSDASKTNWMATANSKYGNALWLIWFFSNRKWVDEVVCSKNDQINGYFLNGRCLDGQRLKVGQLKGQLLNWQQLNEVVWEIGCYAGKRWQWWH